MRWKRLVGVLTVLALFAYIFLSDLHRTVVYQMSWKRGTETSHARFHAPVDAQGNEKLVLFFDSKPQDCYLVVYSNALRDHLLRTGQSSFHVRIRETYNFNRLFYLEILQLDDFPRVSMNIYNAQDGHPTPKCFSYFE